MLVYRGVVSTLEWQPEKSAAGLLVALFESYVRGDHIEADMDIFYEKEGILHVSFGRGQGHTTAILEFLRRHESLSKAIISHEPAMLSGVSHFDTNPRNRYMSVTDADLNLRGWIPDVIFIDLSWYDFNRHLEEIYRLMSIYAVLPSTQPAIICTISDGVRSESIEGPVRFRIDGWSSDFTPWVISYDISPEQQKESLAV